MIQEIYKVAEAMSLSGQNVNLSPVNIIDNESKDNRLLALQEATANLLQSFYPRSTHTSHVDPAVMLNNLTRLLVAWAEMVSTFGLANYIPKAFKLMHQDTMSDKDLDVLAQLKDIMEEVLIGQSHLDFDPAPPKPSKFGSEEESVCCCSEDSVELGPNHDPSCSYHTPF